MASALKQIRAGFVGDSITHGTGDETLLGWPLRVGQAERANGFDVVVYNLGIRADTSELAAARWEAECAARLPESHPRVTIFALGINDSAHEKSPQRTGQRVELERSAGLIIEMLQAAKRFGPSLWVGPTPVVEAMMPLTPFPDVSYDFSNDQIARYNREFAARAAEAGIGYLDLFTPFSGDAAWSASLQASDGLHPTAAGYEMMAARVGNWPAWRQVLSALP